MSLAAASSSLRTVIVDSTEPSRPGACAARRGKAKQGPDYRGGRRRVNGSYPPWRGRHRIASSSGAVQRVAPSIRRFDSIRCAVMPLAQSLIVALADSVPVDDVVKGGDVVGPTILVKQIIGVFPD